MTHLKLGPHACQYIPEDFARYLKHLIDAADGISAEAETEVLLDSLYERCLLAGAGAVNDDAWIGEDWKMAFEDRQDQVKREEL